MNYLLLNFGSLEHQNTHNTFYQIIIMDGLKERARMRQSLELAKEVQLRLLPKKAPKVEGLISMVLAFTVMKLVVVIMTF